MLTEMLRFKDYGGRDAEVPRDIAVEQAAHYRRAAEYIADPTMSPFLLKLADEYEVHARG